MNHSENTNGGCTHSTGVKYCDFCVKDCHSENTHKEGCTLNNVPIQFASCTCGIKTENTKEKQGCNLKGHLLPVQVTCIDCGEAVWVCSEDEKRLYAEARVREEMALYIQEVLLDFHKARLEGAPGYDFFFELNSDLNRLLTPKDTK